MKIKKIEVKNFKAISEQEMQFNGCSAIVTAGNNKGKTTILRGLIDRFRSEKPDIILKEGEDKGFSKIELTDGSVIDWKFTEKSESFSFTTKNGIKQTTGVLSAIGERYFGRRFDIDKFLNSTPKAQIKELQDIVGLDFTDIDHRYKLAYDNRTEANREVTRLRALNISKPEKVDKPDIDGIKKELQKARQQNENRRVALDNVLKLENKILSVLTEIKGTRIESCFDEESANKIVKEINIPIKIDLSLLENKLDEANEQMRRYDSYERDLQAYKNWLKEGKEAKVKADEFSKKVSDILVEKKEMISGANMPEDFNITDEVILYQGLPLTNAQISSSSKYIAALKLGAMVLGEVKSLHFDASFLDKNSLDKIQEWANSNDLQLLIERPDFEGGEIKYEVI